MVFVTTKKILEKCLYLLMAVLFETCALNVLSIELHSPVLTIYYFASCVMN